MAWLGKLLDYCRRRPAAAADPQRPRCSRCKTLLGGGESVLGAGAVVLSSRSAAAVADDYVLYNGSVCVACRAVFCLSCLAGQVQRCPRCEGSTLPAYRRHLGALAR